MNEHSACSQPVKLHASYIVTKGNSCLRMSPSPVLEEDAVGARSPPQRRAAEWRVWSVLFFSCEPRHRGAPVFSIHTPRSLNRDGPVHTHPNTDAGCEFKFTSRGFAHPHAHTHTQHPLLPSHILIGQICLHPQRTKRLI